MSTLEGNTACVNVAALSSQHQINSTSLEPQAEPTHGVASRAPILITEKQVLFRTATAVPVRPSTIHRWPKATGMVVAAIHRMFLTSTSDGPPPRRDYPKRYVFLENSCMAREMDRL